MQQVYELVLSLQGKEGTIAYKKHVPQYRFVDTIGFICPFLVLYGNIYKNEEAIALGVKQITTFNEYALLGDTFMPCHAYRIDSKIPTGLFGWGRGLGWYAIGLIDAWKLLPDTHAAKKQLTESVVAFAKMAMRFQNENGAWRWLIMEDNARFDSSTTATLAWFLKNTTNLPEIGDDAKASYSKALHYLMKVTRRNGAVDFSQGDTKAIGIHSQHFDILPFTQGFVLRSINLN